MDNKINNFINSIKVTIKPIDDINNDHPSLHFYIGNVKINIGYEMLRGYTYKYINSCTTYELKKFIIADEFIDGFHTYGIRSSNYYNIKNIVNYCKDLLNLIYGLSSIGINIDIIGMLINGIVNIK